MIRRARFRRTCFSLVAAGASFLVAAGPAGAVGTVSTQAPEPAPAPPSAPPVGAVPALAPQLAEVGLSGAAYQAAVERYENTLGARDDAIATLENAEADLIDLAAEDAELTAALGRIDGRVRTATTQRNRAANEIEHLAVSAYVNGSPAYTGDLPTDAAGATRERSQQVLAEAVNDDLYGNLGRARTDLGRAETDRSIVRAQRTAVRTAVVETVQRRDNAGRDQDRLSVELVERQQEVEDEARLATVAGTDFPLVVLDAYVKAAETQAFRDPGCGITWWGLAGIGRVESRHGTFGGAQVRPDGSLTQPIRGIPLNGTNNTAAIGDTDGGALDGDPTTDRAMGPMQFIPSTWVRWAYDGNADGVADPQNVYDATAAAAAYLCASGPSLTADDGLRRAYFSYNHSGAYVEQVLATARSYQSVLTLPS